jgi:hypothetical protein
MNVREKVAQFRALAERHASAGVSSAADVEKQASEEMRSLRDSCYRVHDVCDAVGRMPPSPHTARARIGGILVSLVRRMLFWYTPQIVRFQREVANSLHSVCNLLELPSCRATGRDSTIAKRAAEIAEKILERQNLATQLRGDCIYALGRKADAPATRFPSWLYDD